MDGNGRYELIVERLRRSRERRDGSQLLDGLRAFRLDAWYGGNVVGKAATDAGFSRSSLYEYRNVWEFYWQIIDGERYSAWRIIRLFPHLTYTHLRHALELEDLADALPAFEAAAVGDPRFPEFGRSLPMSSEAFGVYVAKLLNKPVPPFEMSKVEEPIFHYEGNGWGAMEALRREFLTWSGGKVRIEVYRTE